ncbi:MAG: Amidohydrolase [Lentisphaerae bacterium ADurb.Bin242]|nr:MAG: Amidohydrolase [Lentisphaerae bacterium ADurb.Bin242]
MLIDIHVHMVEEEVYPVYGKQTFALPQQLIRRYDAVGIERGVVLPLGNVENVPGCCQSNEEVLRMARNFPGRFIPFCNVDPRACHNSWRAPLGDILRYYRDKGCKGIGEVCANLPFLDPRVQNLFHAAEEAGLPLTFHISPFEGYSYGLVDDQGLPQLEESLKRFPRLKFFGHSQTFWAEISTIRTIDDRFGYPAGKVTEGRIPKLMRKYGNLYGDLSAGSGCNALKRDRAHAVKFLNEFQDRLFFGTDICAPDTPTPLVDFLLDLRKTGEISEEVFRKVARENAIRILELEK